MKRTPLYLYNSLGRKLQEFVPIHKDKVHLYTCGPTVYHYAHIGNLRAYIFTDILRRVFQWKGYEVLHVMNITDVGHLTSDADEGEDKMELAVAREKKSIWEIAEYYTDEFKRDLSRLNIISPSLWSKATDHIQEMITFAQRIHDRGYTYMLEDGLYFDTSKVKDYGQLALLDLEGQQEGARVEATGGKRQLSDFAIWRLSPKGAQRQMEWHSPWGIGAPGWHLECSCMSIKYLGDQFDIHTGGIDHRQVHHCNEIAQNQAYLDDDTGGVNYWLHNEFLVLTKEKMSKAEKMSKSSGDFLRLETLVDAGFHPAVYRFFVLNATYRTPLNFSMEALVSARTGLGRLLERVGKLKGAAQDLGWQRLLRDVQFSRGAAFTPVIGAIAEGLGEGERQWIEKLDAALSQDFNTPQGISLLFQLLDDDQLSADSMLKLIAIYDLVFGLSLLELAPDDLKLRVKEAKISEEEIESLITQRREARARGDYKAADDIRNQLLEKGVLLKDSKQGTTWEWDIQAL